MNASGVGLAVSIMLATACFSPSYNEVRCDRSGACPDGLTCDVDGMCRSDVLAIDAQAIDAQSIDAQAADASSVRTVTLSQSSSLVIAADNSLACTQSATGFTAENSYYRAFHLADHGVSTEFAANRIDVAVESAVAGSGTSQAIEVRLYTVDGTFPSGVLTQIAAQMVTVPNATTGTILPVTLSPPGVAPAGSTVVAEVYVPDGRTIGNTFYVGSNAAAETGPSYIRSPDCGASTPVTFASTGNPAVHIILTVTGIY